MTKVTILKLLDDGTQKPFVVCRLQDGGSAACEGDKVFIKNLYETGVTDYPTNKKLFPKDGAAFLAQLKHNFKSGYLSVVEED